MALGGVLEVSRRGSWRGLEGGGLVEVFGWSGRGYGRGLGVLEGSWRGLGGVLEGILEGSGRGLGVVLRGPGGGLGGVLGESWRGLGGGLGEVLERILEGS